MQRSSSYYKFSFAVIMRREREGVLSVLSLCSEPVEYAKFTEVLEVVELLELLEMLRVHGVAAFTPAALANLIPVEGTSCLITLSARETPEQLELVENGIPFC
jgi:hypothetical protein